jgi:hypothetical protein
MKDARSETCAAGGRVGETSRASALLLAAGLLLLLSSVVLAQAGGGYDLSWSTVAGGGGTSEGGGYSLCGTAGQPNAGVASGGAYLLAAGFWLGGAPAGQEHVIYLPLVVRNY